MCEIHEIVCLLWKCFKGVFQIIEIYFYGGIALKAAGVSSLCSSDLILLMGEDAHAAFLIPDPPKFPIWSRYTAGM